jgi:hypothetical protein
MLIRMHKGIETRNHWTHVGDGFIIPIAIMFWGDDIGDANPPTFEASAIPRIRQRPKELLGGKFLRIGYWDYDS